MVLREVSSSETGSCLVTGRENQALRKDWLFNRVLFGERAFKPVSYHAHDYFIE